MVWICFASYKQLTTVIHYHLGLWLDLCLSQNTFCAGVDYSRKEMLERINIVMEFLKLISLEGKIKLIWGVCVCVCVCVCIDFLWKLLYTILFRIVKFWSDFCILVIEIQFTPNFKKIFSLKSGSLFCVKGIIFFKWKYRSSRCGAVVNKSE